MPTSPRRLSPVKSTRPPVHPVPAVEEQLSMVARHRESLALAGAPGTGKLHQDLAPGQVNRVKALIRHSESHVPVIVTVDSEHAPDRVRPRSCRRHPVGVGCTGTDHEVLVRGSATADSVGLAGEPRRIAPHGRTTRAPHAGPDTAARRPSVPSIDIENGLGGSSGAGRLFYACEVASSGWPGQTRSASERTGGRAGLSEVRRHAMRR